MEYRLISENCSHGGRSMLALQVVREIEAVKTGARLQRMFKDGDDIRNISFTDGMQYRLLFHGERCVLETPVALSTVGMCSCNSVGVRFPVPRDAGETKRFALSGFVTRIFYAFKSGRP